MDKKLSYQDLNWLLKTIVVFNVIQLAFIGAFLATVIVGILLNIARVFIG